VDLPFAFAQDKKARSVTGNAKAASGPRMRVVLVRQRSYEHRQECLCHWSRHGAHGKIPWLVAAATRSRDAGWSPKLDSRSSTEPFRSDRQLSKSGSALARRAAKNFFARRFHFVVRTMGAG